MGSQSKIQQRIQQKERRAQELRTAMETLKVSNVRPNKQRSGGQLAKIEIDREDDRWTD